MSLYTEWRWARKEPDENVRWRERLIYCFRAKFIALRRLYYTSLPLKEKYVYLQFVCHVLAKCQNTQEIYGVFPELRVRKGPPEKLAPLPFRDDDEEMRRQRDHKIRMDMWLTPQVDLSRDELVLFCHPYQLEFYDQTRAILLAGRMLDRSDALSLKDLDIEERIKNEDSNNRTV